MSQATRLAAAFALAAGLTAAGVALAQTQPGSAAPPPATAQPAPAPAQSAPPWDQTDTTTIKPWDSDTSQKTYSVDAPPDSSSGLYLPAVVLGYAKSTAGCVVLGCEDGPQVGGDAAPPASAPAAAAAPPPPNPGSPQLH
jgi:hypothetical protein